MHVKAKVLAPVVALLATLLLVEWTLDLSAEWLLLTFLLILGLAILLLATLLAEVPSLDPCTWVFVITYAYLALPACALWTTKAYGGLLALAGMGFVLGVLWWGVRLNRRWAWVWSRRVYTGSLAVICLATVALPFVPGEFREAYVADLGWIAGTFLYVVNVLCVLALLHSARSALEALPQAR